MNIVIVDYGMGNIKSIVSALKYLDVENIDISNNKQDLSKADRIILPGVGSFAHAMNNIKKLNLDCVLEKIVLGEGKPILGICLGMQLMTESSAENGLNNGLGFISAQVKKFVANDLKIPHVGFNQVAYPNKARLYKGLDNMSDFYFTHSYQVQSESHINQAMCEYGGDFIASYEKDNIAGVQFHPELSQTNGLKLLENFIQSF